MLRPLPGRPKPVSAPASANSSPTPTPQPVTGLRGLRLVRRVHVIETVDDVPPSAPHPLVAALRERWPAATVVEAICKVEGGSDDA